MKKIVCVMAISLLAACSPTKQNVEPPMAKASVPKLVNGEWHKIVAGKATAMCLYSDEHIRFPESAGGVLCITEHNAIVMELPKEAELDENLQAEINAEFIMKYGSERAIPFAVKGNVDRDVASVQGLDNGKKFAYMTQHASVIVVTINTTSGPFVEQFENNATVDLTME